MFGLTIRAKSAEGSAPLHTRLKVEGKSLWVNLRLMVDIQEWNKRKDTERKMVNYLMSLGHMDKLNAIELGVKDLRLRHRLTVQNLENLIENVVLADTREKLIEAEQLKEDIEERRRKDVKRFIKEYVDGIIKGEILNTKGRKYSKNSINSWKQFRRIFFECFKNQSFTWDELSQPIIHKFLNYMDKLGYMGETKNRHIGVFSTFITIAEKQKLHTNGIARKWLCSSTVNDEEKRALIYLTKEELNSLHNMPLTGLKEQVRDLFLIACYTALRYSDFSKIKKGCIGYTSSKTHVIRLSQQKTQKTVVIPILNEELVALLEKYDYNAPDVCEQIINRYIKEICQELSETVPSLGVKVRTLLTKTEREGMEKGRLTFEFDDEGYPVKPRYELVACHTARRTAITNMYLSQKFTTQQMMSVSGHKKEDTFKKYVRLSNDEKADEVARAAVDGLF
ncbi:MAG: tyrosine-type recombinase/integrase [Bacteroides sp.]|nr:tyrosine-type recombinase/integrase [Bacteroides sp.]